MSPPAPKLVGEQVGEQMGEQVGEQGNAAAAEAAVARATQEHEFRIGCVGFGDTLGILTASVLSMPLQLQLCSAQVDRGYTLCKQV